ncbi:hypothetical protein E5C33_13420 [Stenotrophomonas maltophilia]|nr:hypothetical protein E5C33_13420 [Stenotrophomonas maltophilia]
MRSVVPSLCHCASSGRKEPRLANDWRHATETFPILIVERNETSVMSTDALIATAKMGLQDACKNYRSTLVERRGA